MIGHGVGECDFTSNTATLGILANEVNLALPAFRR